MSISNFKMAVCTFLGMLGGLVTRLFGGWSEDMVTLVIFMATDYIMGLIVAGVFKNSTKSETGALDSRESWKGLCKNGVILAFVMIAHRMDIMLDTNYIRTSIVIGFVANEALSILENAGLMGLPLPAVIVKAIEVLNKGAECDEDNSAGL